MNPNHRHKPPTAPIITWAVPSLPNRPAVQVPLADWTIPSAQVIFRSIGAAQRNAAAQQNQQIQEGYHDSAQRKHRTHYRPDRISTKGTIRPKNYHESMHHGR